MRVRLETVLSRGLITSCVLMTLCVTSYTYTTRPARGSQLDTNMTSSAAESSGKSLRAVVSHL